MKHGYVLCDDDGHPLRCTASLIHYNDRTSIVTGLQVANELRGQGNGSKLLKLITDDADTEGIVLLLGVEPDASLGLSYDDLTAWYKRKGFRPVRGNAMQRQPRKDI